MKIWQVAGWVVLFPLLFVGVNRRLSAAEQKAEDFAQKTSSGPLLGTGGIVHAWPGDSPATAFSPDGKYALVGDGDALKIWDISTGQLIKSLGIDGIGDIRSISVSTNGQYALLGYRHGISMVDLLTKEMPVSINTGYANAALIAPNTQYALLDQSYRIGVLDIETKTIEQSINVDYIMKRMLFSPNGDFVLMVGNKLPNTEPQLLLWDARKKEISRVFKGVVPTEAIAISSDSKYVITGTASGKVEVWNIADGKLARSFGGQKDSISALALSPDGRYLITNGEANTVQLWDFLVGQRLRSLGGDIHKVIALAFAPDGRHALCVDSGAGPVGSEGGVKLLDTAYSGALYDPVLYAKRQEEIRLAAEKEEAGQSEAASLAEIEKQYLADLNEAKTRWLNKKVWLVRCADVRSESNDKFNGVAQVIDVVAEKPETLRNVTADLKIRQGNAEFFVRDGSSCIYDKNPIKPEWDNKTVQAIYRHKFFMGMPADAVRLSLGHPLQVNRTVTEAGIDEQWVYSLKDYVYMHNGKLYAIQTGGQR